MQSTRIRLRYSTIMNYVAALYRLLTAILFAVIVIRKLSIDSFGLWVVTFSLSNVFSTPSALWNYWMFRFTSRGRVEAPTTGLIMSLLYVAASIPLYVAISWLVSRSLGGFDYIAIFGSAMVLSNVLRGWATTLANALAPEVNGYSGILFNSVRIALAYALVAKLGKGLAGAFLSFIVAQVASITLTLYMLWKRRAPLRASFNRSLAASWLKRFYVPILGIVDNQVTSVDRSIAALVTSSLRTSAIMGVVYTVRAPLVAGAATVPVLSARVLRTPRGEDVEESLRLTMFFTLFTLTTVVSLAIPIISLYNPRYVDAYPAFIVLSLATAVSNFASVFIATAVSSVRSDMDLGRELFSTKLFRTPLAKLIIDVLALSIATLTSWIAWIHDRSPLEVVEIYSLCWLGSSIAICIVGYIHAVDSVKFRFPWRELSSTLVASIATAVLYHVLGFNTMIIKSFWSDAPRLALAIALGFAVYASIEYLASPWFRSTVKTGLRALLSR